MIDQTGLNLALERIKEISILANSVSELERKNETYAHGTKSFSKILKEKIWPIVHEAAKENNLDPSLVNAVIEQESAYNQNAVSSAGAMGLMQLMPGTARELGVKDPLNPVENIRAGTKYLSSLLNRYQGNVILALSAYNAGPNNVDRFKGMPPFKETKNYVKKIIKKLSKELA